MILSDKTIKEKLKTKEISIEPFNLDNLQPASYDVTLGNRFLLFDNTSNTVIDPEKDNSSIMREVYKEDREKLVLHPNEFVLCATKETIGVNDEHLFMLNGKSSLGRLGLLVHATAGFIDPGNDLNVTLEMFNVANMPIILRPGMKIGQVVFETLTHKCDKPYGHPDLNSKYYKDKDVKGSQMHKNYEDKN